jgi:ABC-type sugar transport system ATPase subunit
VHRGHFSCHRANGVAPPDSKIPVTVDVIELLGNEIFVYLTMDNGDIITARMDPDVNLERGMRLDVTAAPDKLHFFDPETEYGIYV